MKKCTRCGEIKHISEFSVCNNKPQSRCKKCKAELSKIYRVNNREKYLDSNKKYRLKNKDILLAKSLKYYHENSILIKKKRTERVKKLDESYLKVKYPNLSSSELKCKKEIIKIFRKIKDLT